MRAYTFEAFCSDATTVDAVSACVGVAARARRASNPLFLVGPTRSGKTHLLCAIENAMETNVMRMPAPMFASRIVDAIRCDQVEALHSEIAELDALLLDDLDILGTRAHMLEEVARTFGRLAARRAAVVATSSRPEVFEIVSRWLPVGTRPRLAVLRSKI